VRVEKTTIYTTKHRGNTVLSHATNTGDRKDKMTTKTKPKPPIQKPRRQSKKPQPLLQLFDEHDEWLTTNQAAVLMVKAATTLRTMRSRGNGPQTVGEGANTRYRKSDCLAWVQHGVRSADELRK
jgi:hypothetical protein